MNAVFSFHPGAGGVLMARIGGASGGDDRGGGVGDDDVAARAWLSRRSRE